MTQTTGYGCSRSSTALSLLSKRGTRNLSLRGSGIQQVLESQPAPVEVEIHKSGRPSPVLGDDQFGRALHPVAGAVHLLPIETEDDVRVLLERAAAAQVVQRRSRILAVPPVMRQ